jgi:hypothetical protein
MLPTDASHSPPPYVLSPSTTPQPCLLRPNLKVSGSQSYPSSPPFHDATTVLASPSPPCLLARNPIPAPSAAVLLALAGSGNEEPTVPRPPLRGSLKGISPPYILSLLGCCLETSCNEAGNDPTCSRVRRLGLAETSNRGAWSTAAATTAR